MLSLLGSLLGFLTSFLPKVLGWWEVKRDQAHELAMMDKQLETQKIIGNQKMQMVNIDADIRETEALQRSHASITRKGSKWAITLAATVRPIITYLFFVELMLLTWLMAFDFIDMSTYQMIWNNDMQAVWAAVVSFWFGQRSFNRK